LQFQHAEIISKELQKKCPSFFSDSDRLKFEGHEALQAAKSSQDSKERVALLEKSLQVCHSLFRRVDFE
jgi:hypothetical protein